MAFFFFPVYIQCLRRTGDSLDLKLVPGLGVGEQVYGMEPLSLWGLALPVGGQSQEFEGQLRTGELLGGGGKAHRWEADVTN